MSSSLLAARATGSALGHLPVSIDLLTKETHGLKSQWLSPSAWPPLTAVPSLFPTETLSLEASGRLILIVGRGSQRMAAKALRPSIVVFSLRELGDSCTTRSQTTFGWVPRPRAHTDPRTTGSTGIKFRQAVN